MNWYYLGFCDFTNELGKLPFCIHNSNDWFGKESALKVKLGAGEVWWRTGYLHSLKASAYRFLLIAGTKNSAYITKKQNIKINIIKEGHTDIMCHPGMIP